MRTSFWARLARSTGRGPHDPRAALRRAGFSDEEQSTRWLHEVVDARADRPLGQLERTRAFREARTDLTMSTEVYIVDQAEVRESQEPREEREG